MLLVGKSVSVPRAWTSNSNTPILSATELLLLITDDGVYIRRRGPSILVYATGNHISSHVPYQCFFVYLPSTLQDGPAEQHLGHISIFNVQHSAGDIGIQTTSLPVLLIKWYKAQRKQLLWWNCPAYYKDLYLQFRTYLKQATYSKTLPILLSTQFTVSLW